jgi:hypothetical protein
MTIPRRKTIEMDDALHFAKVFLDAYDNLADALEHKEAGSPWKSLLDFMDRSRVRYIVSVTVEEEEEKLDVTT